MRLTNSGENLRRTSTMPILASFAKPPRDRALEREQRRVGYGAAASNFFEMSAFSAMNVIAGWISPLTVAAWALSLNVLALVFMVPLGLSTATAVMVGRAYGASDARGLRRAAAIGFAVTAVFSLAIALCVWPAATLIAPLYTSDAGAIVLERLDTLLGVLRQSPRQPYPVSQR